MKNYAYVCGVRINHLKHTAMTHTVKSTNAGYTMTVLNSAGESVAVYAPNIEVLFIRADKARNA